MWKREPRVRKSEGYEQALIGKSPCVAAHKDWMRMKTPIKGVATTRIAWMYARHGPMVEGSVCRCGHPEPTRAHWAWECPENDASGGRAPPQNEGENRLCVPLVRRPRRGWVSREWGPLQGIRDEVLKQLRRGGKALIATDGGAMGDNHAERVGPIGVAVGGARAQGPLGGIDQTSYMAEVWALYKVMRSIAGVEGEIWVIIDNQSVQREADRWRTGTRKGVGNCPGIW